MPADRDKGKSKANNPTGGNQHSSRPLLEQYPDLPQWIQGYIDNGIKQPDMPRELSDDHGITVKLRSIECIIKNQNLRTTRHSGLTDVDKGAAILAVTQEDPLVRWGGRKIKEKLSLKTIHVPRKFIDNMRGVLDRDAADMRKPGAKKVHTRGLWSAGPNEEWCVDGHEKILLCMGIAVWGIIDKYTWEELNLWAVPDARTADVPPALYLLMVRAKKGMPMQTTSDMGSETGGLAAAQTSLRQIYLPDLPLDSLPAHRSVKSVYNITRERGWRPIWEKELANVKYAYETGKISAGFHPEDPIHQGVSLWLWEKIVQLCLDDIRRENSRHRVRFQRNKLLPTGGTHGEFYKHPERWGGRDQLVPVDVAVVDRLIEMHTPPRLFQFGTDEMVALCEGLYSSIGCPDVSAINGWDVFKAMINQL
ncbi:hypothetical protein B0H14DRAFT_3444217 [Mycena olivaceomarginata]|nr:hypothetical protein B0H14DRAFT_3444217 [Mycena olivaceomarginata]